MELKKMDFISNNPTINYIISYQCSEVFWVMENFIFTLLNLIKGKKIEISMRILGYSVKSDFNFLTDDDRY